VLLPLPAGAEINVSGSRRFILNKSISLGRDKMSCATGGRLSLVRSKKDMVLYFLQCRMPRSENRITLSKAHKILTEDRFAVSTQMSDHAKGDFQAI
jgi:hypothetical protein